MDVNGFFHGLSISTINIEQSSVQNPLLFHEQITVGYWDFMGFPEWMLVPGVLDIITPHNKSTKKGFLSISRGQQWQQIETIAHVYMGHVGKAMSCLPPIWIHGLK